LISTGNGQRLATLAVSLLFALVGSVSAFAQPAPPPPPRDFFTDSTGRIPVEIGAQIEQKLRDLERASSNQVLVVVGDRVPESYAGIEEYANRTAQAWRVGDRARDNGAVLFVFLGDRRMRLEVGYGLEGALPDALASRIINDEIAPRFREGRFGEGLLQGVDAIVRATRGEYQPVASSRSKRDVVLIVVAVAFFLLIGVILPMINEIRSIRDYRTYSGRGSWGGHVGRWGGGGWSSGGRGWSSGGGSSWGGGGGGFSGGGGSFGGCGASGSW
jgi:uncharacterized protein